MMDRAGSGGGGGNPAATGFARITMSNVPIGVAFIVGDYPFHEVARIALEAPAHHLRHRAQAELIEWRR
jgi:hypothetical protein